MADLSVILPIITIILGISGNFLPFIDSRKEFRERVGLERESLKERLAECLDELLNHVKSVSDTDEDIRGNPDLVKRYTGETWRTFEILTKIAWLQFWFRFGHLALFLSVIFAFLLVLAALMQLVQPEALRNTAVGAILIQIVAIMTLYFASNKMENYEFDP